MSDSAGPSKKMSVEEIARNANKPFWEVSQELEEAGAASGDRADDEHDGLEGDDAETTDGAASGGHEDDATTDGGDHTDGGGDPTAPKEKKERKDRTPQVLSNVTDHFTEVTPSGLPVAPEATAKGYSMQLGCILRESVSINTKDIRSTANKALRDVLLQKLHQRYTFPEPFNKKWIV